MFELGGAAAIDSWERFVKRLGGIVIEAYKDLNDRNRPDWASESVESTAVVYSISWK